MPVTFPYDRPRAHQGALWFLHRHGGTLDVLKLVKLLFFADRLHLWRYGRPITGGEYKALPHGPVAAQLLDDLSEGCETVGYRPPQGASGGILMESTPFPFVREGQRIRAGEPLNDDFLAESDLEVLEEVDREYGLKDAITLRGLTHELKVYAKNWRADSGPRAFPIAYEDFFDDLPQGDPRRAMLDIMREDCEARESLG